MARSHNPLIEALLVYLVLLPLFAIQAEARPLRQPTDPQPPPAVPRPVDPHPHPPAGGIVFTPLAKPMTVRSLNGFRSDTTSGLFRHEGHGHDGGIITVASPWGEAMQIRYWLTPHGVSFEYDDDLVVRYRFDTDGTLAEIEAESPFRQATMAVGHRAELVNQGVLDFASFDMSAYEVIEEAVRAQHSEAFLDGLSQAQGALQASCPTALVQCAACILGWAATVPAIAAACVVGGVVTFGLACFAAILAHETSGIACSVTCVDAVMECRGRPSRGVIPDGCEPRY